MEKRMSKLKRISLIFVLLYLFCALLGGQWVWKHSYNLLVLEHQAQLDRFASHITSKLDKYAHIPELLSQDQELVDALIQPQNSAQIELTNRYLEHVNDVILASDTYLIDQYGTTISASNWDKERSFVGRNFAFRPYFKQAIVGSESQYFALGSTSGLRGYYYSYPVTYAAEIIGVVVVKMDLSAIEDNWTSKQNYFVASDKNHVIFMSSNPDWLFHSLSPLADAKKNEILASRQYLDTNISSLNFSGDLYLTSTELTQPHQVGFQGDFITSSRSLPGEHLTIRVMSPKVLVLWDTLGFVSILTLIFAVFFLIYQLIAHRQQRQRQIDQVHIEANQKLEFQVMERTAELHAEIHRRAKTEEALIQTQDELVQAAKLAVLGQMSASISHELNNPLAAIRSYAENGKLFLMKDKPDKTIENLTRISSLTERMAKISQQLKSFARRSSANELIDVQLNPVILSAKELLKPQLKSSRVNFDCQLLERDESVVINPIQLEQVLINLLTNGIQALDNIEPKQLSLSIEPSDEHINIHIEDNGSGIDSDKMNNLFEPFYTTKKNGLGLGLSISQQIMQSMNGNLFVSRSPLGGARFTVQLLNTSPSQLKNNN